MKFKPITKIIHWIVRKSNKHIKQQQITDKTKP